MTDICRLTVPCPTCPWRVASVGGSAIPGFSIEQARALSNTVGPGDDFRPVMACHGSPDGAESACVGYLAVEGYSNLAVRLAAIEGAVDLTAIVDACADIPLHPSFDSMLEALEEAEALDA